jgi:hypothetical protein
MNTQHAKEKRKEKWKSTQVTTQITFIAAYHP